MQYPNKETVAEDLFERYAGLLAVQHGKASRLSHWKYMSDTVRRYWTRIAAELIRHSSCWLPNKGLNCALDPAETKRIESWIPYTTYTSGKEEVESTNTRNKFEGRLAEISRLLDNARDQDTAYEDDPFRRSKLQGLADQALLQLLRDMTAEMPTSIADKTARQRLNTEPVMEDQLHPLYKNGEKDGQSD